MMISVVVPEQRASVEWCHVDLIVAGGTIVPSCGKVPVPLIRLALIAFGPEETALADDTTNRGEPDCSRVAAGEGYESEYIARKQGITAEQARELTARMGNDRDALYAAAVELE